MFADENLNPATGNRREVASMLAQCGGTSFLSVCLSVSLSLCLIDLGDRTMEIARCYARKFLFGTPFVRGFHLALFRRENARTRAR